MSTQPPGGDDHRIVAINERLDRIAQALERTNTAGAEREAEQQDIDRHEQEVNRRQLAIDQQQLDVNGRQVRINVWQLVVSSALMFFTLLIALESINQSLISRKALKDSECQFEKTLEQIKLQTQAQSDSATAAKNAVDTAHHQIDLAQDQLTLEQRAWVGLNTFGVQLDPGIDQSHPGFVLSYVAVSTLVNSGKTPATRASAVMGITFKKHSLALTKADESWLERRIAPIFDGAVPPRCNKTVNTVGQIVCPFFPTTTSRGRMGVVTFQSVDYNVILPNLPIPYTHPEHWGEKQVQLSEKVDVLKLVDDVVIFGEVKYRDVVAPDVPRFTKFCIQRAEIPSASFTACPILNDMR